MFRQVPSPLQLTTHHRPKAPCRACGVVRLNLMEIDPLKLKVPDVDHDDFLSIIERGGGSTIAPEELDAFVKWTEEFGQEG